MNDKYESMLNQGWLPIEDAPKDGANLDFLSPLGEEKGFWYEKRGKGIEGYFVDNEFHEIENPTHYRIQTTPAQDEANRQKVRDLIETVEVLKAEKNSAYSERNKCVVGLMLMAKALGFKTGVAQHDPFDTEWEDDWRNIAVIELPTGQITWHFHDSEVHLLKSFNKLSNYKWDGHTTEEKYRRLLELTLEKAKALGGCDE